MWFLVRSKYCLWSSLAPVNTVGRWVWHIMPAMEETHALRDSHSRHAEPPTKGLTAGMRSPHMDVHDASTGDSLRNMPAVALKTGHLVEGSFRQVCVDFHKDLLPDGISRYRLHCYRKRAGSEKEREWVLYYSSKAGHSLSRKKRGGAGRDKTTPACQKRLAEKKSTWMNLSKQNK